jgi:hypothetical protein
MSKPNPSKLVPVIQAAAQALYDVSSAVPDETMDENDPLIGVYIDGHFFYICKP